MSAPYKDNTSSSSSPSSSSSSSSLSSSSLPSLSPLNSSAGYRKYEREKKLIQT